ncbi:hypothetical protein BH10BDE1_BH10BDE1_17880 [soil metagenome]
MKLALIAFGIFASSSFALAAPVACPAGATLVKSCDSTPQPGDSSFASEVFKSISICTLGAETLLVFDGENQSVVATVEARPGGTTYSAIQDTVKVSISFVSGTRRPVPTAKFTVDFTEAKLAGSSTYTCQ